VDVMIWCSDGVKRNGDDCGDENGDRSICEVNMLMAGIIGLSACVINVDGAGESGNECVFNNTWFFAPKGTVFGTY